MQDILNYYNNMIRLTNQDVPIDWQEVSRQMARMVAKHVPKPPLPED